MSLQKLLTLFFFLPILCFGQRLERPGEKDVQVTPMVETGNDLDLQAVAELFKTSESLEDFEMDLNNPDTGINNLDLDEDGYTDYIRVMEEKETTVHYIGLQALLLEDDVQDVAVIVLEQTPTDDYNMEIQGDESLYGEDYYVSPAVTTIRSWPIFVYITRPNYRPYRSVYYYGHYPPHWKRYHPVTRKIYKSRFRRHVKARAFVVHNHSKIVHNKIRKSKRENQLNKRTSRLKHPVAKKKKVEKNKREAKKETRKSSRLQRPSRTEKNDKDKTTTKEKTPQRRLKRR